RVVDADLAATYRDHVGVETFHGVGVFAGLAVDDGDFLGRSDSAGARLAGRVERAGTGGEQVRDENRGEDADDRDDDQQLDEGETTGSVALTHVRPPQLGPLDSYG